MTTAAIISNSVLPTPIPSPTPPPQSVKCDDFVFSDKLVQQLLSKLAEVRAVFLWNCILDNKN